MPAARNRGLNLNRRGLCRSKASRSSNLSAANELSSTVIVCQPLRQSQAMKQPERKSCCTENRHAANLQDTVPSGSGPLENSERLTFPQEFHRYWTAAISRLPAWQPRETDRL